MALCNNIWLGSKVHDYKLGDRVQRTNHGSEFTKYSVDPRHATYILPDMASPDNRFIQRCPWCYQISANVGRHFQEAVTFGLSYITAALTCTKNYAI